MAILVTGGAGFIGSNLAKKLLDRGEEVIIIDDFNDYYDPKLKIDRKKHFLNNKKCKLIKGDVADIKTVKKLFAKHKIKKVVHLAARAGVRASLDDPFIYERTNVLGTLVLLEVSKDNNVENFVFGSSSSVYGMNKKVPFSEKDNVQQQISPYAATKIAGEALCHSYSNNYKLNISCLRFFTVYGPWGRPDMAYFKFTKNIIEGTPIEMYGDGSTKRDYTFVEDIVSGIIAALDNPKRFEVYNLGNSKTVELKYFIEVLEKHIGKKAVIKQKPIPKGDVLITYADLSKSKKKLKYSPKTNIEEGLKRFVEWYKDYYKV